MFTVENVWLKMSKEAPDGNQAKRFGPLFRLTYTRLLGDLGVENLLENAVTYGKKV